MYAGPIGAADTGSLIDISTPWNLTRTYVVNEVLLSNNLVNSDGTLTPLIYSFIGILLTFLITRGITRFIRRRSGDGQESSGPVRDIVVNGVHIHHQVFGIILMTMTSLVLVGFSLGGSALAVMATVLGIGIGLAFDEFALWFYLDDVYWGAKGQQSVDAVAIVLVLTGVVAVTAGTVTDIVDAEPLVQLLGSEVTWLLVAAVVLTFVPPMVCLVKGKPITGGVGVLYVPLGLVGAIRLAKPGSWWARHFYAPQSKRMTRSRRRFGERYRNRWDRIRQLVGGAPTAN